MNEHYGLLRHLFVRFFFFVFFFFTERMWISRSRNYLKPVRKNFVFEWMNNVVVWYSLLETVWRRRSCDAARIAFCCGVLAIFRIRCIRSSVIRTLSSTSTGSAAATVILTMIFRESDLILVNSVDMLYLKKMSIDFKEIHLFRCTWKK